MSYPPLPWQEELFDRFCGLPGAKPFPERLPLPTGLGKTAVTVVWYLAQAAGAPVPRRLVYVVDRRAVVDQATTLADRLKKDSGDSLAVSTLRGKHVDNRDWLADPAAPAVIVGTVDMIGSRLLFSGYGVSTGMRPCHAGLLGADTLLVLDEAHLCPAFEALLGAVAGRDGNGLGAAKANAAAALVPPFRLLVMSATLDGEAPKDDAAVLSLSQADRTNAVVRQRLTAAKHLRLEAPAAQLAPALAKATREILEAAAPEHARVVVYCHGREVALKVRDALAKAKAVPEDRLGLLVGVRRVRERENVAKWLADMRFSPADGAKEDAPPAPAVLVATAAGEVGVDLDADHMVCDLVAWERMVQRLGRVNRRGGPDRVATITVIPDKAAEGKLAAPLRLLSAVGDARDASLAAIEALSADPQGVEAVDAATTTRPLCPALDQVHVEAWSLTSLPDLPARPAVGPWLRGWQAEEDPSATVVWRRLLPVRDGRRLPQAEEERFFDVARPHMTEGLEAPLWDIGRVLAARASRKDLAEAGLAGDHIAAFVLDGGEVERRLTLDDLRQLADKKTRERLLTAGITLVVDARLGGIDSEGVLSEGADGPACTLDGTGEAGWDEVARIAAGFRVTRAEDEKDLSADWRRAQTIVLTAPDEAGSEEPPALTVWVARTDKADRRGDPAIARSAQSLAEHAAWTEEEAGRIAEALGLPPDYAEMLRLAARAHDDGKDCDRWQNAMNAPRPGRPYAKTTGTGGGRGLDGYRHEFGSLGRLLADGRLDGLPEDLRDLALHLVTSHHGHARPTILPLDDEAAPVERIRRSRDSLLRFARLQKHWGPWGLAWWEAVLRAADRSASARLDEGKS